jgi:hypothetical protein
MPFRSEFKGKGERESTQSALHFIENQLGIKMRCADFFRLSFDDEYGSLLWSDALTRVKRIDLSKFCTEVQDER